MNLLKKAALASALALTLGVSAQAAVTNVGTVTDTTITPTATTNGSFTDLLNFSVAPNAGAGITASAVSVNSWGASLTSLALYSGTYTSVSSLSGVSAIWSTTDTASLKSGKSITTVLYEDANLSSTGTYTLVIGGTSNGVGGYSTTIALAPVPEPETYAMLLAGLGVMGFVARRRQKGSKQA